MPRFHGVTLDEAQPLLLEKTGRSGTASARTVPRARILLQADTGEFGPGWLDTEIADDLDIGEPTVERTRKRAGLEGIEAAGVDQPRPRRAASSMVRPRHGSSHSAVRLPRMVEIAGRSMPPGRPALPARPATDEHDGTPHREDYEYVRCGTANLFLSYEPLANYRHVAVTERRTRTDWADAIKDLVEVQYPDAKRIILVLDNLNIHSPASLYQAFPAAEARRLTEKWEIHYTPKHGSWLNMAYTERMTVSYQITPGRPLVPTRPTRPSSR